MSLLDNARQCSAAFHWGLAEGLSDKILEAIQAACDEGKDQVFVAVSREDRDKGEAAIKALSLQGFSSSWEDEGYHRVYISWLPRVS